MVCNIMKTYKISPNYLRFFLDISTIYEVTATKAATVNTLNCAA